MTQAPQGTWFFMCLHRTGSAVRRHAMGQSCAGMWACAECLPRAMTFTPRGLRTSSATGSCSIVSFGAVLAIPSVGESTALAVEKIPQRSCDENSFESLSPSRAVSKQAEVLLSSRTKMQRYLLRYRLFTIANHTGSAPSQTDGTCARPLCIAHMISST